MRDYLRKTLLSFLNIQERKDMGPYRTPAEVPIPIQKDSKPEATETPTFADVVMVLVAIGVGTGTWLYLTPTVFVDYWRWFIEPLGVKSITHWHALGITSMYNLLVLNVKKTSDTSKQAPKDIFTQSLGIAFGVMVLWALGYMCR